MEDINDIARFLIIISGVLCAIAFFILLIKSIVNGNETENYKKKMRNCVIAFALIITVPQIINVVQGYFVTSEIGIGKIPEEISIDTKKGDISLNDKDRDGREIVIYQGIKYVVYERCVELYYRTVGDTVEFKTNSVNNVGWTKFDNIRVDVLKKYSDCQGLLHGFNASTMGARIHFSTFDRSDYSTNIKDYTGEITNGSSANAGIILNSGSFTKKSFDEFYDNWQNTVYPQYRNTIFSCYRIGH